MGDSPTIPQRLLQRLDDLGKVLEGRGDALALIGLSARSASTSSASTSTPTWFFVVVADGAKQRYLDAIDWLEALCRVDFSFENSVDGRKVLFVDGLFAEYAVFTLGELRAGSFPPGRLVWARSDAPEGLERCGRAPDPSPYAYPEYHVNEAVTNLYVGLHRELRGERLAATRLIQQHAVDRLLTFLELTSLTARQDTFAIERGVERGFGSDVLPLTGIVVGYDRNRDAALAILDWLEARVDVDRTLAAEIRRLAVLAHPAGAEARAPAR